jgi:hypothetical protein
MADVNFISFGCDIKVDVTNGTQISRWCAEAMVLEEVDFAVSGIFENTFLWEFWIVETTQSRSQIASYR